MTAPGAFTPEIDVDTLRRVAQARILYADTDKMGIVYHASYFRYLELSRVELIREAGLPYTVMEDEGLALPLVEIGVRFAAPGLYDDLISVYATLSLVTRVRVHFQYRVMVEAGDREGLSEPVELLRAETRHCCVRRDTGRPERLPVVMYERLAAVRERPPA
ncbi:MAG: thioesterase family protein [Myxococcota bacterium]